MKLYKQLSVTLLLLVVCLVVLIPTASAELATWDNWKIYDSDTRTVIIRDLTGEIGQARLNTHLNVRVGLGYQKVAEFDLWAYEDYNDALKQFTFTDMKKKEKINRNIDMKILSYEEVEVNDYKNIIIGYSENGTAIYENTIIGTHFETREKWTKVTPADLKKNDMVTIGLFTNVEIGDYVDWIPTIYGVEVKEWATWTANLNVGLISYFKLDDNGANTSIIDSVGTSNGVSSTNTNNLYDASGRINSAFNLTRTSSEYLDFPHDYFSATSQTYMFWIKPTQTLTDVTGTTEMIYDADGHRTVFLISGSDGTNRVQVFVGDLTQVILIPKTDADIPNWYKSGQWAFIVLSVTSGTNNLWTFSTSGNGSYSSTTSWTPTTQTGLQFGRAVAGNQYYDGDFDEIGLYGRAISFTEATNVYNAQKDGYVTGQYTTEFNTIPNITLNSPSSANYTTIQTPTINFTAWDDINLDSVKLYVNGVLNQTNASGINNTNYLFDLVLGDGTYVIYGKATDNNSAETSSSSITINIDATLPTITLQSPNGTIGSGIIGGSETLNVTFTDTNLDSCWYDYNGTNVTIDGCVSGVKNSTTFTLLNDNFNMTIWTNDTYGNEKSLFTSWQYNMFEVSQSYYKEVLEGSSSAFSANLTLIPSLRLSSIAMIYNGTSYSASASEYEANKYYVSRTHNIPLVNADVNITFYWNVTLETGSPIATSSKNQTIKNLGIDNCSTNTFVIFNFTMADEDSQTKLVGSTDQTKLDISLVLSTTSNSFLPLNYSGKYNRINPAAICTSINLNNSAYRVDALVEYSAKDKFVEYYNIQNYLLTNATGNQNITLYNLNSSKGTEFKVTYKDSNFNLVPGALIQIQRKYINEGIFKTVEIPMIGSAGYTIAHLLRNDAIYNLIVLKNGVILDSFTNIVADCQNPTLSQCVININSFSSSVNIEEFSITDDFTATLTYNSTTRAINSTFLIPSGTSAVVSLNVTLIDGLGSTLACSDTLTASGGTLGCIVPNSFGNSTVVAQLYVNGAKKIRRTITLTHDASAIYGGSLIFISLIMILLIIGMSITDNPMTLGIMLIFGIIILTTLNIINSVTFIGTGATILWLVIAIVIILIKGSSRH